MRRKRISLKGFLRYLGDCVDIAFPMTRKGGYLLGSAKLPELSDYYPSSIKQAANRLQRRGFVEVQVVGNQTTVKISDRGKRELLRYELDKLSPPDEKWDGKWRLVFFDVDEINRIKRDKLRALLKRLGMEQLQESVFISPYDIGKQVRFLREVLEVPHCVKMAEVAWIENAEELRDIFQI